MSNVVFSKEGIFLPSVDVGFLNSVLGLETDFSDLFPTRVSHPFMCSTFWWPKWLFPRTNLICHYKRTSPNLLQYNISLKVEELIPVLKGKIKFSRTCQSTRHLTKYQ